MLRIDGRDLRVMFAPVARVGDVLGVGRRTSWAALTAGAAVVTVAIAMAARMDLLPVLAALLTAGVVAAAGFRWPLLPLLAFAAMIPVEEMVVINGVGTFTRLAGILFALAYAAPRLSRLSLSVIPVGGWAFIAWSALSLGWAASPPVAWSGLFTLAQLFLVALLVANLVAEQPDVVHPLLWTYGASAAVTAVIAVGLYVEQGVAQTRAAAIAGQDPAQFAAILLPALAFGLHETISGRHRIPAALIALVAAMAIVVSGTRGAWLGAGVMFLVLLAHLDLRKRFATLASLAVLALVILLIPGVATLVAERAGSALSSGGEGRTDIWTVGLLIYSHSPVVGFGYANFPVVYTLNLVRASGVASLSAYVQGRGPHNLIVGTLVELGPLGVVMLAVLFAPLLIRRGWGRDWPAVQGALASLLTVAMFLDVLADRKQVWLVIGLAAGLQAARRRLSSAGPQPEDGDATGTGVVLAEHADEPGGGKAGDRGRGALGPPPARRSGRPLRERPSAS
jgi:O-antigen ligase